MSSTYAHSTTLPELTKRIAYNKDNRDYDCFIAFDGTDEQCIGSAASYGAAEKVCNDYAYDYYNDNHTPEKAVQVALAEPTADYAETRADVCRRVDQVAAGTSIRAEEWADEDGHAYIDFKIGDGLTKVLIGSYSGDKAGVELIIGGESINSGKDEVLTLSDVRQLRDNLTALLNDPRLGAVMGGSSDPAPTVRVKPHICDDPRDPRIGNVTWVDYIIDTPEGAVEVVVSDRWPPQLYLDGQDVGELARYVPWAPAIVALMAHPDIQAALARAQAGAPQKPIAA
jgi:hypothetical protein